jgi:hypothetical protein
MARDVRQSWPSNIYALTCDGVRVMGGPQLVDRVASTGHPFHPLSFRLRLTDMARARLLHRSNGT